MASHKNRTVNRSKRGIALISVLSVSVILLAMAGAFFAAHKTDLVLMTTSKNLEKTKNAALSASEFFVYKLQNDRYFGVNAFTNETEVFPEGARYPLLSLEYVGEGTSARKNVVKGEMPSTGLTFEARLLNNLNSNEIGYHAKGDTPPRSARVWITAKRGAVVKHMDFILKRSPLSSVAMLSGGNIDVHLTNSEDGHWWLGARQPSGNAVRANGTITGPEVLSPAGRAVLFEPPPGMEEKLNPPYGVIQGENLNMQLNGVSTDLKSGDERLADAGDNIRGVLSPGGADVKIPELDSDKLSSPERVLNLPAKKVSFRTRVQNGRTVHELVEDGKVTARYDGTRHSSRFRTWHNDHRKGPGVTFDLENRIMKVADSVELRSTDGGEFVLADEVDENGLSQNQPTLVLGSERKGASIKAKGINIEGSVGGMGALKAGKGDLSIRAKSSLSTTPDFGIALHSDRDVTLSQPGQSNQDGIPTDWDAFSKAYQTESSSGIDNWAEQDELSKTELAAQFSGVKLTRPGQADTGNDPIWLSLTKEYPADESARKAYDEWMQEEIPEETIEVPLEEGEEAEAEGEETWEERRERRRAEREERKKEWEERGRDDDEGGRPWSDDDEGETEGGESSEGSGESTEGSGESTEGSGESTEGSGESTEGSGESTEGSGESTEGSGESTEGSGESTEGSGESTEGSGESTEGSGESTGSSSGTKTVVVQPHVPEGPGMNVENYVRLREYLKTVKSGKPDDTWLGSDEPDIQLARRSDVKKLIKNQLSSFQLAAGQTTFENRGHVILKWNKLGDYFNGDNPFLSGYTPDMKFRGLIYAGDNFSFNTNQQGIELEGALVAGKDINISNATGARFIYNAELLENLFSTNEGDNSAKLEKAFWAYY